MKSLPTIPVPSAALSHQDESIRHLPEAARTAFARFQAGGDPAVLDPVLFSILEDYIPRVSGQPLAELPGATRLIDDLGFDSLAMTEVVFFAEDLFGINITNEEIVQVSTLDDLRRFIRAKLTVPAAH